MSKLHSNHYRLLLSAGVTFTGVILLSALITLFHFRLDQLSLNESCRLFVLCILNIGIGVTFCWMLWQEWIAPLGVNHSPLFWLIGIFSGPFLIALLQVYTHLTGELFFNGKDIPLVYMGAILLSTAATWVHRRLDQLFASEAEDNLS